MMADLDYECGYCGKDGSAEYHKETPCVIYEDCARMRYERDQATEEIERLRKAMSAALERLDASLFTNAEHSQAKDILRSAIKEQS